MAITLARSGQPSFDVSSGLQLRRHLFAICYQSLEPPPALKTPRCHQDPPPLPHPARRLRSTACHAPFVTFDVPIVRRPWRLGKTLNRARGSTGQLFQCIDPHGLWRVSAASPPLDMVEVQIGLVEVSDPRELIEVQYSDGALVAYYQSFGRQYLQRPIDVNGCQR